MTGKRVMVIDDHRATLQLLSDILEADGYEVIVSAEIDPQLHRVREASPDLLVVDLLLSTDPRGLSGWDVVRLAKSHADLYSVPCLVISADYPSLRACEREARGMSKVALLPKPFQVEELRRSVADLLSPPPTVPMTDPSAAAGPSVVQ